MNPTPAPIHSVAAGEIVASLREVVVTYDNYQTRALTGVSFEIRRGEIFALLGPPDSGKSTTLRLLAGRLRPTEGSVRVFGRSARSGSTKARLAYLGGAGDRERDEGMFAWLNVFARFFAPRPVRSPEVPVDFRPRPERRSALAQVLGGARELILLDEPFVGLDEAAAREAKELIRTLAGSGRTVVLGSSSLSEARELCQRAAVFYEGKIQAVGTFEELLATPDAIRFLGPVLPARTAAQVLELMRAAVVPDARAILPPAARPADVLSAAAVGAVPAGIVATADEKLAPLARSAATPPPSETPRPDGDPVDHEKLAELTRTSKPA